MANISRGLIDKRIQPNTSGIEAVTNATVKRCATVSNGLAAVSAILTKRKDRPIMRAFSRAASIAFG